MGFNLAIASPANFQPKKNTLIRSGAVEEKSDNHTKVFKLPSGSRLILTDLIDVAAKDADLLYTDVWVSMGKEAELETRINQLSPYQVNKSVVALAKKGAPVMHCLPAYRGKEIDEETFEANADAIFTQAENRLHTQKSILRWITL